MSSAECATVATPIEPFTTVVDADGAVLAYRRGETSAVDAIVVRQRSGPFIEHASRILRTVPPGSLGCWYTNNERVGP